MLENSNAEKRALIHTYAKAKRSGISTGDSVYWQPVKLDAWHDSGSLEQTYLVSDGGKLAKEYARPELDRVLLTVDRHFRLSFELDSPEDIETRFGVEPLGREKEVVMLADRKHLLRAISDLEDLAAVVNGLRF